MFAVGEQRTSLNYDVIINGLFTLICYLQLQTDKHIHRLPTIDAAQENSSLNAQAAQKLAQNVNKQTF